MVTFIPYLLNAEKGIDVAHEKNVLKIFKCGEGSNPNPS